MSAAIASRQVTFFSDGIRLDGLVHFPDRAAPAAGVVVFCSGYQGLKELIPGKFWEPFTAAGFTCLSFDYRGFGTSDGERGRLLPREWIADALSAVSLARAELASGAVGMLGWGFGGGIAVAAAAEDERIAAIACLNGIGDGGRAVRSLATPDHWRRMQELIEADRATRARTGASARVGPWDVVPLDPTTRAMVDADMYARHPRFATDQVSLQSAEEYYRFRPEELIGRIAPRPVLIAHGELNGLHPVDEGRRLYALAGEPRTYLEVPGAHHLDWIEPGTDLAATWVPRIVEWFTVNLRA